MERPYQICSKTVMDISDPGISFDEDGISNHYWEFQDLVKPNWHAGNQGQAMLENLVDTISKEGAGKEFDCIMGLSGGVDSSYLLHVMVTQFGLRPLVFHVDGGWNSEIAVNNINNLVENLKLDLFTEVINWEEMKNFQLAMFKSGVPHLDIPQDMAFIGVLYKFAEKHGIKHIINGGNIATESVLCPIEFLYWGTDMLQIKDILSKFGTTKMETYPFSSVFYHKIYLKYFRGVKVHKPLNYMHYIKEEAKDTLVDLYNWKPYAQKHFESRFTSFFEGYWLPTRFNWDMRRIQFSSLILSEQMTREEALVELEVAPYDKENIAKEVSYIAAKLGISAEELMSYHQMPKKFYWDYRNLKGIFDLGEKVLSKLGSTRRGGAF